VLVDEELAANDVRCPAKLGLPEIVREDDDRTGFGSSVVRLFDDAAQSGPDAENREITCPSPIMRPSLRPVAPEGYSEEETVGTCDIRDDHVTMLHAGRLS